MLSGSERHGQKRGFTLAELLVSLGILMLISLAVVQNVAQSRQTQELRSSANLVASGLRDLQAQALAARSLKACLVGTVNVSCDLSSAACGGSPCNLTLSPEAFGMTLITSTSSFTTFADISSVTGNRREDLAGRELIERSIFPQVRPGMNAVVIDSLLADSVSVASSTLTFERQSGSMRINACLAGGCTPAEANVLQITLRHLQTQKTKVVLVNAITGRISVE
ncbi:MAG: prepilin-type N-terminal cleavage/methylation domain-containing protein [Candidatus Uhrbacteria bacterium]|nr:prepilin-type N-terminal cleavage/methylation domain-containing protein [Candidatus Uhrbacteria bacterium]